MSSQPDSLRPPAHPPAEFPESLRGKRILLCTESFGPVNGVSRTTLMLVNHLRANGANVAVVAPDNHTRKNTFVPRQPSATPEPAADDVGRQSLDVRIQGYPLPYNPELSIVYPVRLSTLYRRTFETTPDLIYLASPASLGFQVMLQLRQQPLENQVPIICNFQTDLAGYCNILFPPPFSNLAVLAFSRVQSFLFNHSSVKTLFYPSRFIRRYLEKQRVKGEKLEILQRGVDTQLFHPRRQSDTLRRQLAPNNEIILICVSRLGGEKGFEFLAEAAKELDARGLDFKLHIVGGNRNAAVETEIKDAFSALVDKGKVVFAGFLMGEELATAYASADIFLHCSITETFGLVVLESMASGVPVVARDEGGPSDTVRDGKTGFLTPPESLDSFVEKVMLLAGDVAMRKQFSEDARSQAEEATWDKINNQVAWRMADTIAASERERAEMLVGAKLAQQDQGSEEPAASGSGELVMAPSPLFGWLMMSETFKARAADARVLGGMAAISASWIAVGAYLVFINAGIWVKKTFRGLLWR
ncbi:glycosyltransferase family 4 protein [Cercophora newfieldiana]|uniref:Glycosyltransferase family 4 protein n=1 Tax=Cercophora newfieldiana TaxID=92897 RepID=A0AA39XZJ9_9PEZI|nr:glycosyltransferase family 4 protein [Cercophora newfieldiana]